MRKPQSSGLQSRRTNEPSPISVRSPRSVINVTKRPSSSVAILGVAVALDQGLAFLHRIRMERMGSWHDCKTHEHAQ